jgi:hypothetical protein
MKTMSFISSNKLSVMSFRPLLQLYLQINNLKKLKLWRNLMLCKKVGLSKNKQLQNKEGWSMFNIQNLENSK